MGKRIVEVEGWSIEELIAAVMTAGSSRSAMKQGGSGQAREVALELLSALGGLGGLARSTSDELEAHLVASPRFASAGCSGAILASFELGRRAARDAPAPASMSSSAEVAAWAVPRLLGLDHEELWLLALDGRSQVRAIRCVAKGGLHGMGVRPADPLRLALRAAASGFVLVHNHPSGDPTPSREDVNFTRRVAAAAAVVGMPLLDHVVVGRDGFASVPFPAEPSADAALASPTVAA